MTPFQSSFRSVAAINLNLLAATGCGFMAWAIWPSAIEWWGFGVTSILLGAAAFAVAMKAGGAMIALRAKQHAMADYMALGTRQKSAHIAGERELGALGLLDE